MCEAFGHRPRPHGHAPGVGLRGHDRVERLHITKRTLHLRTTPRTSHPFARQPVRTATHSCERKREFGLAGFPSRNGPARFYGPARWARTARASQSPFRRRTARSRWRAAPPRRPRRHSLSADRAGPSCIYRSRARSCNQSGPRDAGNVPRCRCFGIRRSMAPQREEMVAGRVRRLENILQNVRQRFELALRARLDPCGHCRVQVGARFAVS